MKITTIGIDLAKTIFQVHGVNEHGKVATRKKLKRAEMLPFFANLPSCLIGMEACGSAHHWARKLQEFKNGRQLAAWMGLVPRQSSSGGKQNLLGISKRGDTYLRTLMIHGARSVIYHAENKAEPDSWLRKLMGRRNKNIAAAGLANKNARIIWALLAHDRICHPDYTPAAAAV